MPRPDPSVPEWGIGDRVAHIHGTRSMFWRSSSWAMPWPALVLECYPPQPYSSAPIRDEYRASRSINVPWAHTRLWQRDDPRRRQASRRSALSPTPWSFETEAPRRRTKPGIAGRGRQTDGLTPNFSDERGSGGSGMGILPDGLGAHTWIGIGNKPQPSSQRQLPERPRPL